MLQPYCLPVYEKWIPSQMFSKGFKLLFRNTHSLKQFPVVASSKRWSNPLESTGRSSI